MVGPDSVAAPLCWRRILPQSPLALLMGFSCQTSNLLSPLWKCIFHLTMVYDAGKAWHDHTDADDDQIFDLFWSPNILLYIWLSCISNNVMWFISCPIYIKQRERQILPARVLTNNIKWEIMKHSTKGSHSWYFLSLSVLVVSVLFAVILVVQQ